LTEGRFVTRPQPGHVAIAGCLLIALVLVAQSASGSSREDRNDAEGPLDLAHVRLSQEERQVEVVLRVHGTLPPLAALTPSPSSVEAGEERYLCVQLEGRAIGRRLLCPAGEMNKRKLTLGVSSYGKSGYVTRRGSVIARAGLRNSSLKLNFGLKKAELAPGRFKWRLVSGWTGEECVIPPAPPPASGERARQGAPEPAPERSLCLDSAPDQGFVAGRFHPVRRVGCTRDEDLVSTHASRSKKKVALTFDDGPSSYTRDVLRILDREGAKGTFYVVGDVIPGRTSTLRAAIRHDHELANHSMHHEQYPGDSSMEATSARIEAATGFSPCTFRPPYGLINGQVASTARANGMSSILWDVDTVDWTQPGSDTIYSRAVNGARAGSIILMHDGGGSRQQTVAALPRIIETLESRGFELVTVTEILGEKFIWKERHR
jgi:peptidoglycan/xylan/chitin deacetylase (PgdA/CDA1 family)